MGLSPSFSGTVHCTVAVPPAPGVTASGTGASGADRERTETGKGADLRSSTEVVSSKAMLVPEAGVTKETLEPLGVRLASCTAIPLVCFQVKTRANWLSLASKVTVVPGVTTADGDTDTRASGLPGERTVVPSQLARMVGWCG